MQPSAVEVFLSLVFGIPLALALIYLAAVGIYELRKDYKYHRLNPERYGKGQEFFH